ncbi:hypothetical protein E2C01_005233 [Portunus trituberculatus]|uniref:Uncharacterized protein n=1 Tax=Portunus trituberculatus TaxID=210409 RepID=A0A5B7CUZ9_PORTR|nr:hypothetical protein [Portunus trituberculatus]
MTRYEGSGWLPCSLFSSEDREKEGGCFCQGPPLRFPPPAPPSADSTGTLQELKELLRFQLNKIQSMWQQQTSLLHNVSIGDLRCLP